MGRARGCGHLMDFLSGSIFSSFAHHYLVSIGKLTTAQQDTYCELINKKIEVLWVGVISSVCPS